MPNAEISKQTTNYLDLLPPEALARIIFFLPVGHRDDTIATMPEFCEALKINALNLRNIAEMATEIVKNDKDFKAAAALVQRYRQLVTQKFCKKMARWLRLDEISTATHEIAEAVMAAAKSIDSDCITGMTRGFVSEIMSQDHGESDEEDEEEDEVSNFDWRLVNEEYVKLIWCRFGNLTVQFVLKPSLSSYGDEPTCIHGGINLNVYKQVGNDQFIYSEIFCNFHEHLYDFDEYTSRCFINTSGIIPNTEENVILGAAIGLAGGVGRWKRAEAPLAYSVPKDLTCTVENIACALRICGRSIKTAKATKLRIKPNDVFEIFMY